MEDKLVELIWKASSQTIKKERDELLSVVKLRYRKHVDAIGWCELEHHLVDNIMGSDEYFAWAEGTQQEGER